MPLKLRVISDHYKELGKTGSQLFGVTGGLIGRAPDNDWILPDPDRYISSHHAKVSFRAGAWLLEDTSTNGVYVNDRDSPISVTGPYKLKDGDRLRLGDYDIVVSIDERNDFSPDASGQMPAPEIRERRTAKPVSKMPSRPMLRHANNLARADSDEIMEDIGEDLGAELDITGMFVAGVRQADTPADAVAAFDRELMDKGIFGNTDPKRAAAKPVSLLDDVVELSLPRVDAPIGRNAGKNSGHNIDQDAQNDDWHMSTRRLQPRKNPLAAVAPQTVPTLNPSASQSPRELARELTKESSRESPKDSFRDYPRDTPVTRVDERPRRNDGFGELSAGVEALCRGAGIDPSALPSDAHASLLNLAGQMLREVVLDLMEALRNRGDQKNRLHVTQTTIQPAQNNPLKFSAGVDEALRKLLDAHSNRYLGPVEALREAFNDLKNHQMAMDTAMHAALNDLLTRVDPAELQERFDRGQKRNALLGAVSKGKYWELYTEFFPLLNQRDGRGWPSVFTEEFTRAYSDKVDALENQRRK